MEENATRHVTLLAEVVSAHERRISELNRELEGARGSDGTLVWRLEGVGALLADAKAHPGLEVRGPAFYHRRHGYRLAPSLFPGGEGTGAGSHLSLYVRILPGDYDGVLEWPFHRPVTLRLLDQASDLGARRHRAEAFTPNPSWQHFQRPPRAHSPWKPSSGPPLHGNHPLGFGYPRFISLESLKTGTYIRDDVIFIEVRVDDARIT